MLQSAGDGGDGDDTGDFIKHCLSFRVPPYAMVNFERRDTSLLWPQQTTRWRLKKVMSFCR